MWTTSRAARCVGLSWSQPLDRPSVAIDGRTVDCPPFADRRGQPAAGPGSPRRERAGAAVADQPAYRVNAAKAVSIAQRRLHHWYLADDQQLRQDTHFRYYGLGDVVRYEHLEDT